MSDNTNLVGVSTPEELHILVERNKEAGWPDLTSQRKAFAHEYVTNGYKHRAAAEEVGITASSGIRIIREPLVAAYVESLQEMQLANSIITKDFINAQYIHLYEMATGLEAQHCVTADGEEYTARKTELGTAHNILDKMSKSIEYVKDTGNKSANVSVNIDMGSLFGDSPTPEGSIIDVEVEDNG